MKTYPNNKPWVSKTPKELLYKKKKAFKDGDRITLCNLQKEIKCEIQACKRHYKEKIECQLKKNNLGSAWESMKTITGTKECSRKTVQLNGYNSDLGLAQSLNDFYVRFDACDFSNKHTEVKNCLMFAPPQNPFFNMDDVTKCFKKCKPRKSPGPDHIGGRLLKTCAEQLGPIFNFIFNMSLHQQRVPSTWKQSVVVPIAKTNNPTTLNDFRPVALTSMVMKQFEKLVKAEIITKTEHLLDPLQFAYRENRGVQDATATLLNLVYKHLEESKNHARLLFVDLSSAFNTIQPHVLVDKLIYFFGLDACLVGWILDFLMNRSQQVRVNGTISSFLTSSTGSPQGCVLSALLYILYTNDCVSHHKDRFIIKCADDSVIVSLLNNDEVDHGQVRLDFISWCAEASLQINVSKTKEVCIDFRRPSSVPQCSIIHSQPVELVTNYKYLGTIIDNALKFNVNCDMLCKRGQQCLFCLRKLAKFQVDRSLMKMFYSSFIESIISFSIICWYGNLANKDKNSLSRIVRVAPKVAGGKFSSLDEIFNTQVLKKAKSIRMDDTHPLNQEYKLLPSGAQHSVPPATENRYKFSFVPFSIRALI